MKIREIIELSKTDSLAKIAKEHLNVGKEKAREALKQAGCYSKNGLKGWHFDGDESVLEQSIYDFVTTNRKSIPRPKTRINTSTKTSNYEGVKPVIKPALNEVATSLETSASTGADILDRLYAGIELTDDKKEVSFYLTHDVIEVINRTKKGYRSDLVNEALRKVFREKGWL